MSLSKERRYKFRRNLPHLQREGRALFVSIGTVRRWTLPPEARDIVLKHCLRDHQTRAFLHAAVVMPEHVHLLFTPLSDGNRESYSTAEIMAGIKGASAHAINARLGRHGRVWEPEYFDTVVKPGDLDAKIEYIRQNPVMSELVTSPEDYPWLVVNQLPNPFEPDSG